MQVGTATRDHGSGVYLCDPMRCAQFLPSPRIFYGKSWEFVRTGWTPPHHMLEYHNFLNVYFVILTILSTTLEPGRSFNSGQMGAHSHHLAKSSSSRNLPASLFLFFSFPLFLFFSFSSFPSAHLICPLATSSLSCNFPLSPPNTRSWCSTDRQADVREAQL